MPEPSSGIEDVAISEFPVTESVKVPKNKHLSLWEVALCESFCTAGTS
jgi:hypothetical protein